jgi:subtilisin family serine protease
VKKLLEKNIPVVAASGNGSSSKKIDYPACIPEVVAVGATDTRYSKRGVIGWIYPVMAISNSSPDLDYYTLGKYITTNMFGEKSLQVGTSVSTVAFASNLVKMQNSGTDRKELFNVINTTLENAYRSMQDISKKHYSVSR